MTEFFNAIGKGFAETLHGDYGLENVGILAILAIVIGRRYIDHQNTGNMDNNKRITETLDGITPVIEDNSAS